ncbi:ABC transporter ATP-binding protein [Clostridium oceanicum]|uniref:ABC transporter ATP-binding protein n=1 Tax=Clostridium oceanicum TaxID=1543 RepID=A0ABN1JB30_9CLOT
MKVLEVTDVRKKLGKREIIKGINFSVEEGEIFGFLGPNGAGKTTTIRMLVGLIKPNSGSIKIKGQDLLNEKEKALANVGAVVENPELYKYLSGRENLMQIARIRKVQKKEIDELIELVGLKDRIDDKVKKYSLGMKQRLGLAASLISNPSLLILDEPTNGLDPSGILDFREIVRKAARERNMAVFISSHILSEVQELCDRVAFINKGEIKTVERMDEEEEKISTETLALVVKDIDKEKVSKILKELKFVKSFYKDKEEFNVVTEKNGSSELVKALVKLDVDVVEIYKKHKGLEQRYMELVEGGVR